MLNAKIKIKYVIKSTLKYSHKKLEHSGQGIYILIPSWSKFIQFLVYHTVPST